MPEDNKNDSIGNFSDLEGEVLIKQDGFFKIFSHGNLSDFDASIKSEKASTELLDTGLEEKILPPPPPMIFENKKADFYFDIDDRDEIIKHKESLEKIKSVKKQYSLKKITDKIIEANSINLVPQLESKFNNLIFSFLKHTRTKLDLGEVFSNRIINQGLGFEKEKINKILDILSEIRNKIEESNGEILNDLNAADFAKLPDSKQKMQKPEHLSNLDPRQKIEIKPINTNIPFVNRTVEVPSSPHKLKVNDIKQKSKVISPVEELGEINITIFRRISSNPIESAQRIMDNINSFGKESILKKAMAIKNWRKSEVYRIYLYLGRESIDKNIPVDKIIEQKIIANEKTLTLEEFQAVSDINKKIRF